MAAPQRIVVPHTGQSLGDGFNSQTMTVLGPGGIEVEGSGEDPLAGGGTATTRYLTITSQERFEEALSGSVEVDGRYGLASGDAKFSFSEQNAIDRTSTYILCSCVVRNALRKAHLYTPSDTMKKLAITGDKDAFRKSFGDYFTAALRTGGELHVLVRVTSSSTEHQRAITASLNAEYNGLAAAVSFSAAFASAAADATSRTEISIVVHQTAGVGLEFKIPSADPDSVRAVLEKFPAVAHSNPRAYEAELLSYDVLADVPFPSEVLLEDRRNALEDCLVRRRGYVSALAEIGLARDARTREVFEELPPEAELAAVENQFRRALNQLRTHARAVADGSISPDLFVADPEPIAPVFRRRTSGNFRSWLARAQAQESDLLLDERIIFDAVLRQAAGLLDGPLDKATPIAVERAAGQITSLEVGGSGLRSLSSLAPLPQMTSAPLRAIRIGNASLTDLEPLATFSRLESLHCEAALVDLAALGSLPGLKTLGLADNEIEDLTPVQALIGLEVIWVEGNRIETLEPLRNLVELTTVVVASEWLSSVPGLDPIKPFRANPITDARALAAIPAFASCPLTTADRVAVKLLASPSDGFVLPIPSLAVAGTAKRIGDSNRFELVSDAGEREVLALGGLRRVVDLDLPEGSMTICMLWSQARGSALGISTSSGVPVPAQRVVDLFFGGSFRLRSDVERLLGRLPDTLVELAPAP